MGMIYSGIHKELVLELLRNFPIVNLVETGTYNGETASWAADHFKCIYTIEMVESLWKKCKEKFSRLDHVHFLLGDSRKLLPRLIETIAEPTIFWLDAHWSGSATYGKNDECPLVKEIEIINQAKFPSFILIDDARYFLSPPPKPHQIAAWPDISTIMDVLNAQERYIVIVDDVIAAIPNEAKPRMIGFLQNCFVKNREVIPGPFPKRVSVTSKIKHKVHGWMNYCFRGKPN